MSPSLTIHPRQALFGTGVHAAVLPVCDHYAGAPERMRKSLALQDEMAQRGGHALFDVTLDLEDGAALGGEAERALQVAELLNSPANAWKRAGVRVHDLHHPCFDHDVETVIAHAGAQLAYVMVPKLAGVRDAALAIERIGHACRRHGLAASVPVHGLIETHRALQEVAAIAALPGLQSLSFGLMDFVSEHRGAIPATAMSAQGQFHHPLVWRAKLEISAACHAQGITPSHCVVTEFRDRAAVAHAAARACRELGYTRMWSIHPDQIPVILDAFAPVAAEVGEAIEILTGAQAADWAPTAHRGVLQDRASYRHHWQVLERAWLTGQPLPKDIEGAFFRT